MLVIAGPANSSRLFELRFIGRTVKQIVTVWVNFDALHRHFIPIVGCSLSDHVIGSTESACTKRSRTAEKLAVFAEYQIHAHQDA